MDFEVVETLQNFWVFHQVINLLITLSRENKRSSAFDTFQKFRHILKENASNNIFASYNILQYLCDFIHVLILVTVSKC